LNPESKKEISSQIRRKAIELGFYKCGIAEAGLLSEDSNHLKNWLSEKKHAGMKYMENYFEKRTDPTKLFEGAKSVIVVLMNYFPSKTIEEEQYKISKYAYGVDYHFVMKDKLKELITYINSYYPETNARAFVDSAPVLERAWAQRAGLGWIGKNTNLINKEQGSFFFIGEIITDLELEYKNELIPNHCGGCTRCIEACPTDALDKNGLDANKCISYWTIENKGDSVPEKFKGKFEDWIFGCDICQDVCPWNRLSEANNEIGFNLSNEVRIMTKPDWEFLTKEKFNRLFKKSPLKRSKYDGLKRNIYFIKSSGEDNLPK